MAWGVFIFTNGGRNRLAVVLRGLMISELIFSLCIAIFCYNTSYRVLTLLKDIHKATIMLLCGLILVQAYALKLHYTSGLRLISWVLRAPYWSRTSRLCRAWSATGIMMAVNGMLVYAACDSTMKALIKELSSSLKVGISQYLTEPTWKKLLDTMQVELSCCGVERPSDWHEISWLNMDFLNEDSELIMKLAGADGRVFPPVAPYSCCTPRVLAACYHDPLQQSEWGDAWSRSSPLLSASLHTRGCVEAVSAPLANSLLALKCFAVLVALFQVLIVVLTRLLVTSACDAALGGDCRGAGRGSLLGSVRGRRASSLRRRTVAPPTDTEESGGGGGGESTALLTLERRRQRRRWRRRRTLSILY